MCTEKIAKAYFWRTGTSPPMRHAGLVQFFRFLGQIKSSERVRIANLFSFKSYHSFQEWIRKTLPIAYALENLAPALANDGPNPEYPWPHNQPEFAPANHHFSIYLTLQSTSSGRDFIRILEIAIRDFPKYADT